MDEPAPVAVVTGASRGIGLVVAHRLAAAGWSVAGLARTVDAAPEPGDPGGRVLRMPVDVVDEAAVRAAVATIEERLGPIQLLVNNAAISGPHDATWDQSITEWWNVFEVNVRGVLHACHAVLPRLIERRAGRIVNVASNAAFFAVDAEISELMGSAYMASKAALVRFTEALAVETASAGVTVFAVSPGMVKTAMTAGHFPESWFEDESIWSPPELVAELIEHLASGRLDALSGRYIHAANDDWRTMDQRAAAIVTDDLNAMRLRVAEPPA